MKAILISDELHARLKAYTHSQNLFLGKYTEACIEQMLTGDELAICPINKNIQNRFNALMKKYQIEGESVFETDEYKQVLLDSENYWKTK